MRLQALDRRVAMIALCAMVATVCAVWSVCTISLAPPGVALRQMDVAAAHARIAVDRPKPLIGDDRATEYDYETLKTRAVLTASLAPTQPVLAYIARRAGIDPDDIVATAPVTSGVQTIFTEPDSERRADQIAGARKAYRLETRAGQTLPTVDIYAQAPTVAEAQRLADAVAPGVREYLAESAQAEGADPDKQIVLTQLGTPRAALVSGGTRVQIAGFTFLYVFALTGALALLAAWWRVRRAGWTAPDRRRSPREVVARAGDWPRTTRVTPWLIALLMAIVFLVPFNDILLDIPLPIDLYFDRLFLPLLMGAWAVALAAGGRDAPRIRLTWVHGAIAVYVAVAALSVVLGAREIQHGLSWDLAIKKLALLASYVSLFVIVASSVRRTEVRAFTTYTLVLGCLCALGLIIEYRFAYNVFYRVSDMVLPGVFQVGNVDSLGVDEIGRREVRGPGQAPLETVAMIAMVLPIVIARLIHPTGVRWERVKYGIAAAILMAGIVTTFRKSAFMAPISVGLTIAYFRRRELLKLAPLGVVLIIVVQALSPGALTGVLGQLDSSRLGVNTVSDRTADYDAIRPDVWTHLLFGRGYGSYEPSTYRILDMELLRQLVEGGVLGLLAYVAMGAAVVAVARRPIRSRDLHDAPVGLWAAAAAVCYLVVSTLFDVLSFPHVPYIFLWTAALLAVVVSQPREAPEPEPAPAPARRAVRTPEREPAWSS